MTWGVLVIVVSLFIGIGCVGHALAKALSKID